MKVLILSLITVSVLSAECFCTETMKFSDDDLKKFSMRTQPQKSRDIRKIDQETDVIYLKKNKEPIRTSGMAYYNAVVKSYRPTYNVSDEKFIDDINDIINSGNEIKVINLVDKGLITNEAVNYMLSNIENFDKITLLNLKGTRVDFSINVLKLAMPQASIIY